MLLSYHEKSGNRGVVLGIEASRMPVRVAKFSIPSFRYINPAKAYHDLSSEAENDLQSGTRSEDYCRTT